MVMSQLLFPTSSWVPDQSTSVKLSIKYFKRTYFSAHMGHFFCIESFCQNSKVEIAARSKSILSEMTV